MFYYLTYYIMITINLKNVDEVVNTSTSPYEIWDSAINSYSIWWEWFRAESFEEYRLIRNEDSPDIPKTLRDIAVSGTEVSISNVWVFRIAEYLTANYLQTLLEDIQLAVNLNKASYEESLLLNWFTKCQL